MKIKHAFSNTTAMDYLTSHSFLKNSLFFPNLVLLIPALFFLIFARKICTYLQQTLTISSSATVLNRELSEINQAARQVWKRCSKPYIIKTHLWNIWNSPIVLPFTIWMRKCMSQHGWQKRWPHVRPINFSCGKLSVHTEHMMFPIVGGSCKKKFEKL